MKKQLLLVALFSVGIVGNVNAFDNGLTKAGNFVTLKRGMCKFQKDHKVIYKALTKTLTKQVTKLIDNIPHIGQYMNEPKALGTELIRQVFNLNLVGSPLEDLLGEMGLDAEDVGELMFDALQEQMNNKGITVDITSPTFIQDVLESVLLPKSCV